MSFIAELKRRNVIRIAGLYLVGAWLLTQVASTLFPAFAVPGWALRTLVITLAVGLLPALVFAWLFELTPEGLKRDDELSAGPARIAQNAHTARRMDRWILAVLTLAVVYFCVDKFVLAPRREAALVVTTTRVARAEANNEARQRVLDNSIAVLPFLNMSDDKGNQFFSDGISEELLNVLVRVNGLSVASRTSSFAFRDKTLGSQAIGRELNVSHILEGSVRKAGNKVRITAQLIDAVNDRHIWSKTYDRELTDIFAIQDEIANAIVDALRDTMAADAAKTSVVKVRADTQNMQAYELYLKAREKFINRTDLAEAVKLFDRVVELDPGFARGWEGLAAISAIAPGWSLIDRDYAALASQAAERALQLDPSLSTPWAVKALLEQNSWPIDYHDTLIQYDKAIAADPKNATAYLWRGIAWMDLGFFERGLADVGHCLALEPKYGNCTRHKALLLLFQAKDEQAIALFNQGLADNGLGARTDSFVAPLLAHGNRTAALLLLRAQDLGSADIQQVLRNLENPHAAVPDAHVLPPQPAADAGSESWHDLSSRVRLSFWLGNYGPMVEAHNGGGVSVPSWERYPVAFRNSPAMKQRFEKMGVAAYWRRNGFPPQCHPALGGTFSCD
ncbi:MAG: hypothetical protein H7147_03625 [Frankiaceae bacterium]|nr:hypothetical protein [Arenimonas sp.]